MPSKSTKVVVMAYDGHMISYQPDTADYIAALAAHNGNSDFVKELNKIKDLDSIGASSKARLLALVKKTGYVKTRAGAPETGGGTWFHPKLATPFARWLSADFAVWCDAQIDSLIHGKEDWRKLRHMAAASSKLLHETLQLSRKAIGKETKDVHFMTEHKLVNSILAGKFKGLDRDAMTVRELDLLAHLEVRNSIYLGMQVSYDQRKTMLQADASLWATMHISAANDPAKIAA